MVGFILSPLGRIVAAVAGVLVFLSAFAWDQQSRGRQKLLAESRQEAGKINEKNSTVFEHADKPGAADRVRSKYCRDC